MLLDQLRSNFSYLLASARAFARACRSARLRSKESSSAAAPTALCVIGALLLLITDGESEFKFYLF